jgi:hypothetical protein
MIGKREGGEEMSGNCICLEVNVQERRGETKRHFKMELVETLRQMK